MYPAFVSYCLGFKVVCGRANRLEGLLLRTETVMPVLDQTRSWLAARRDRNMKGNHPLCREHRVSTSLTIEKTTPPSCQPSITHVIVTFAPRLMNARHTDTGSRTAATSPIPGGCAVSFPDSNSVS
jgi:hypothetical protein